MTTKIETDADQIRARKEREGLNIFSRLPAVYAASRMQSRHFLEIGGGLSVVEWRTLWDLAEAGPLTIRDLAAIQRADHSLLSRALPEMRKKGFVTMQRDALDGRQTIVELTRQGRGAYEKAAPIMAKRRASLKEVFSDTEIREFAGFLDRLEDFLRVPAEDLLAGQMAQEDTQ
jgi:DNA-binding MarR family transcriptional regulator